MQVVQAVQGVAGSAGGGREINESPHKAGHSVLFDVTLQDEGY